MDYDLGGLIKMEHKIYISRSSDLQTYLIDMDPINVFGDCIKTSLDSIDLYNHGCYICSIFGHPMITWYDAYNNISIESKTNPFE